MWPAEAKAKTIRADVVAIDQPIVYNRLGAFNPVGMVYALRQDVVILGQAAGFPTGQGFLGFPDGTPIARTGLADSRLAGQVALRPDKRPRPIVLRMNVGDTLEVRFANLLNPSRVRNDMPADRHASFHPLGLSPAESILDDGSFVGANPGSLLAPGQSRTYKWKVRPPNPGESGNEGEQSYLVVSHGSIFGGEGLDQSRATGLFGVVVVEPVGSWYYRSQVTEEEMRLATRKNPDGSLARTADGHPVIDYNARYPLDCAGGPDAPPGGGDGVWCREGKAGLPVLSMLDDPDGPGPLPPEIVHTDINAIIAYTDDGRLDLNASSGKYPPSTYPLEMKGKNNPSYPNRLEPFRELTSVFHDEAQVIQAFQGFYLDPVFSFTLHSVRDGFMINYASGGIGSEILANRLGVGPMHDCLNCAYEEFFLSSHAVGDPGMNVDVPADAGLLNLAPGQQVPPGYSGPKATRALYPDDPSTVHHVYQSDFVKIRNLHAGPKEHHIFHLHNHQWLFNPNDDNSNYLDAQGIGPGSSYTYELVFGGSGNRNKSLGDSIFHCHFYPHFAQGMWTHIRHHDVFESGTRLEASGDPNDPAAFHTLPHALQDGTPALLDPATGARARALPDGEIAAGTPIPAIVPLPGKPMAPLPGRVVVVPNPNTTTASVFHPDTPGAQVPTGSLAKVLDRNINPGYPFFIAGIENTVGQRPPTPPLDMFPDPNNPADGGWDGGLPRHSIDGIVAAGRVTDGGGNPVPAYEAVESRLDFSKVVHRARPVYFPEDGTDVEKAAMAYHAQKFHDTFLPDGTPAAGASGFRTNGQPPQPSAPYADPCVDDNGDRIRAGVTASFFDGTGGKTFTGIPRFGADNPRVYKGADIQFDAVFNKAGWHFPQERMITLWDDAVPTIDHIRPPEPLVMRQNALDCVKYLHTNLVPEVYELDDFQVRTPTDIIGQHIHLPKFEVISSDGSGNGWNYEDGTLSPGAVRERIAAINTYNRTPGLSPVPHPASSCAPGGSGDLVPCAHPFFGRFHKPEWMGARTTIQRWFSDPVINAEKVERGLGITFTHDHFGPSTHQQIGLYGTIINEPVDSVWVHNETGKRLGNNANATEYNDNVLAAAIGTRTDGGPTSWQAAILTADLDGDGVNDSYREFFMEFQDFQAAYEAGTNVGGRDAQGNVILPTSDTFRTAINPPFKQDSIVSPRDPFLLGLNPDLSRYAQTCPGFQVRPCPEAISADDTGTFVVNYRNEPVGLRVFDPNAPGPDGLPGAQAAGQAGDLAFALSSNVTRAIPALNVQPDGPGSPTHYQLRPTQDQRPLDPYTLNVRAQTGDRVRIKLQVGATEEGHNPTLHGLKWTQAGSSFGTAPNSGWRNSQSFMGISEQFTLNTPIYADLGQSGNVADYAYSVSASSEGWWNGSWGLIRTYRAKRNDLVQLPNNPKPTVITNPFSFNGVCPVAAPQRTYDVTAVAGKDVLPVDPVLGIRTLVYNSRRTPVPVINPEPLPGNPPEPGIQAGSSGPLHDPTALLYVMTSDLEPIDPNQAACLQGGVTNPGCPVQLSPTAPIEPVVLRAAAGECINVTLRNRLQPDADGRMFDMNGFDTLPWIVKRAQDVDPLEGGTRSFNANLLRPSAHVGIHPQLVEYDVTKADGVNVGMNPVMTVPPGGVRTFMWYAGDIAHKRGPAIGPINTTKIVATPVEFGGVFLSPADKLKQVQKGLIGSLVIEPAGSTWTDDILALGVNTGDPAMAGRTTRAASTVTAPGKTFRDFSLVWQSSNNIRLANNTAVSAVAAEGVGLPEDVEDAGVRAFNYRTEPLWFRYGLSPNFHIEQVRDIPKTSMAYSNAWPDPSTGASVGDPQTPI
ncbi:MAG: hypothetical protein C3F14_05260, partial [Deltaproteobacteria bacterium]